MSTTRPPVTVSPAVARAEPRAAGVDGPGPGGAEVPGGGPGRTRRAAVLLATAVAIFVAATLSVALRPAGDPVATWWPAAGLSTFLVLRLERHRWPLAGILVVVVTAAANVAGGRGLGISAVFGAINAAEAVVAALLLGELGRRRSMSTVADYRRVLLAASAGAALLSVTAAVVVRLAYGASPVATAAGLFPSHLCGQLVVLGVVLSPAVRERWTVAGARDVVIGAAVLGVVAIAFTRSEQPLLAPFPLVLVTGATYVLTPRAAAVLVVAVAGVVNVASGLDVGPLGSALRGEVQYSAAYVQLYVICMVVLSAPLALGLWERREALRLERAAHAHSLEYASLRTNLLNGVTHELRTPLTAIIGYSEMMRSDALGWGAPERDAAVDRVHAAGRRLSALVDDLLDAADPMPPVQEDDELLDLVPLLRRAVVGLAADSDQVRVGGATDDARLLVRGDERRLRRAIQHLVGNALQAAPRSPVEVQVRLDPDPEGSVDRWVEVAVVDRGPGIPADELHLVAQPFGRTRAAVRDARPGVGLGLSLTAEIVAAHGGSLRIESGADGTTVRLRLPVLVAAAAGAALSSSAAGGVPARRPAGLGTTRRG